MIRRQYTFDVTCPAATVGGPAGTAVANVSFPPSEVEWIEIVIPDGHAGTTGIALQQAHGQVIPANLGASISGNDEQFRFHFTDLLANGNWQAALVNNDLQPHSWEIRFGVAIRDNARQITPPSADTTAADLAAGLAELGVSATSASDLPNADQTAPVDTGVAPVGLGDVAEPVPAPDLTAAEPAPADATQPPDLTAPEPAPDDTAGQTLPPDLSAPVPDDTSPAGVDLSGDLGALPGPGEAPTAPSSLAGATPPHKRGLPTGGVPIAPKTVTRIVTKYTTEPIYRTITYPAGGWLPPRARFTVERIDQGQDLITGWRGPIQAPGDGVVLAIGHDSPFPGGFGPAYPIVRLDTGRWQHLEIYVGHATAAVRAGERFRFGHVLAHADQGHVSGGGWVEIGLRSALGQGVHDQGAAIAHMFGPVSLRVQTGSRRVAHRVPERVTPTPPRRKASAPAKPTTRKPSKPTGAGPHKAAPPRAPTGGAALPAPRRKPTKGPAGPRPTGGAAIEPVKRLAPRPGPRPPAPARLAPRPGPPLPAARRPPAPPSPAPRRAVRRAR